MFFTKESDYEEDVYASFELHDYLMCCKELDILQSMIGHLKKKLPNLDVASFKENPENIKIKVEDAAKIMNECKVEQLGKLKGSKNTFKGAILAEYVTEIPEVFNNLIDLLNDEV